MFVNLGHIIENWKSQMPLALPVQRCDIMGPTIMTRSAREQQMILSQSKMTLCALA